MLGVNIPFSNHNQAPRNAYQCLWEEELVWMADGRLIPIKNVCVGDDVLCFDPTTMKTETTKVTHQWARDTDKTIYKVTLADGLSITATEDHMFYTTAGWVRVDALSTCTRMLMYEATVYCNANVDTMNTTAVQVADITEVPT